MTRRSYDEPPALDDPWTLGDLRAAWAELFAPLDVSTSVPLDSGWFGAGGVLCVRVQSRTVAEQLREHFRANRTRFPRIVADIPFDAIRCRVVDAGTRPALDAADHRASDDRRR